MESLLSFPLHEVPHYLEDCAEILNDEWKRSKTARLHVLRRSSDTLPFNIAFVKATGATEEVIGHSRLAKVQGIPEACFVESVIVKKSLRGQGLGRKIMEETEQHAKRLGFNIIYLTTHDKQDFYHHLGYNYSEAVVSIGSAPKYVSNNITGQQFSKEAFNIMKSSQPLPHGQSESLNKDSPSTCSNNISSMPLPIPNASPKPHCPPPLPDPVNPPGSAMVPSPPPPPPPPPMIKGNSVEDTSHLSDVPQGEKKACMSWMKKVLEQ